MEISVFPQILVSDFNFKKYSQKESRLFDAKIISKTVSDVGRAEESASIVKSEDQFIAISNMIFNCQTVDALDLIENELIKLRGIAEYKRKLLNVM